MARDAGQAVEPCLGVCVQTHLHGAGIDRITRGQRKGRCAEVDWINAQQDVVHDRVRHQGDLENVFDLIRCLACKLHKQAVNRLANRAGQQLCPFWVHHHVGDAAHQILTVADLWVHHAR